MKNNWLNCWKQIFWKLPVSMDIKNKIRDFFPRNKDVLSDDTKVFLPTNSDNLYFKSYIEQVLNTPSYRNEGYKNFEQHNYKKGKAKLIAYYLTQYHPTEKNNLWWGKGTTEWTNVTKAVPQFVGHIQPKLPGDLGFYDLRIIDNMAEQIRIAKNYGVGGFCFYYYWFNGERALELPLNMFLDNNFLNIEFSICWCNENWTKRYSGINDEVLLSVGTSEESYYRFIEDVIPLFSDYRYIKVNGKPVLSIYRPSQVPNVKKTLAYWRKRVNEVLGKELYIIASQEANIDIDWTTYGFDAMSQFQPASIVSHCDQYKELDFIRPDFDGKVYDYKQVVEEAIGLIKGKSLKLYPAVMPAWDNTARRNQHGTIFHKSTPELYQKWLKFAIDYTCNNNNTESDFVFINAWNEWGEGAYLEPDREYGYAYLAKTFDANCGE